MTVLPSHVPADRVVDFDIYFPPGVEQDYHAAWLSLRSPARSLVWTPRNGGHWIATRGEDVRALWADAERLSSDVLAVPRGLGALMQFIPLQQDPPEHTPFRNAVMRGFASRFIVAIEPQVIGNARELIEGLAPRGQCDFVSDFAEILPIDIFLTLVDLPRADRPMLRGLGAQLTRPDGSMTVEQLRQAADDYLAPYVEERLARPGDDLLSRILSTPVDGRAWTMDEARRMCRNILFGGLDTVAAMMGFVALHLARHPADQQALRDDPGAIPDAVDELMRRYASVSVSRNCTQDVEIDGVVLKEGDIVYLPSVLHNLDPLSFDDPETVHFDRRLNATRHTTMGVGVHRCVGAGLARMEIIAVVREWLVRIPPFRLDPQRTVTMKGGNVGACVSLPLTWEV
ncbi:cytochrome P450 [Sphingomonas jatrophae]|uniref:Cytochrome P450 n=1 Tax=Sphingomonas jatrophae TaxID=1166337 RepID=A0A1I6M7V1_9SPHN|nr:cytochrome P450 [Sphingomonas jatrophae]SFS11741.1 Cytochrome P450 [Sphingomonas jatrophae]